MEIINPGLFLGNCVYFTCNIMDLHCISFNTVDIKLATSHNSEALVRKDCNDFLKTKQGFHYLMMKYPNLLLSQAVNEYVKEALWIDSIV